MEEENVKIICMMKKKLKELCEKINVRKKSMIKCRRSNKSTIKCWKKYTLSFCDYLIWIHHLFHFIWLHFVTLFFWEKKKDVWSIFLLYNSNSPFWACCVQRLLSSPLNTESRLKKEIKFDLTRWRRKLVWKCKCWLELHKTISSTFHRHQIQKTWLNNKTTHVDTFHFRVQLSRALLSHKYFSSQQTLKTSKNIYSIPVEKENVQKVLKFNRRKLSRSQHHTKFKRVVHGVSATNWLLLLIIILAFFSSRFSYRLSIFSLHNFSITSAWFFNVSGKKLM